MRWHDICFLHWRADASILERTLPPGLELDRFAGEAWISVVPFRMANVRLRGAPVLPGFGSVPEINLRTYVRCGERRGVWFFSLDAASPIAVSAARITTALPYFDARIRTSEAGGAIVYTSDRSDRRAPVGRFSARYIPAGPATRAEPETLEAFLHERYRFFSLRAGRLLTAQLRHDPWQLQSLSVAIEHNTLGALIGHPLSATPDRAWFARALHVRASATGALR